MHAFLPTHVFQSTVQDLQFNLSSDVSAVLTQPPNATVDDTRRRPAAVASAPRLPALRPEDVLIQRDVRGQKVLLGKGAFGEVRPLRLNGGHAAFATWFLW